MDEKAEFLEVVQTGDLARAQALLAVNSALAECRSANGLSAVMLATYNAQADIVELLLDTPIQLNIHEAAALGKMSRIEQILHQQPELVNTCSVDGFTPLGLAAFFGHPTAVRTLISAGAECNKPSSNDLAACPLHSAVAARHVAVAEILLEAGADLNARYSSGYTPLIAAAENGQAAMVRLLLRHGADPTLCREDGMKAIDLARLQNAEAVVSLLSPNPNV
jgi:uncharacterized protein